MKGHFWSKGNITFYITSDSYTEGGIEKADCIKFEKNKSKVTKIAIKILYGSFKRVKTNPVYALSAAGDILMSEAKRFEIIDALFNGLE